VGEVVKIILVILLSSVKFIAGPPFAYYDQKYGFSVFETVLYSVIGGMLGVVVFSYFSPPIFQFWHWIMHFFTSSKKKAEVFSEITVDTDQPVAVTYSYMDYAARRKKVFTRRNRKIVTIWKKFGLVGLAFITPVILSIPIGTVIANSYVRNRKKIFLFMFISILFWSVLMTSLFELYHVVSLKALQQQITE
jgi:hypothetical protein